MLEIHALVVAVRYHGLRSSLRFRWSPHSNSCVQRNFTMQSFVTRALLALGLCVANVTAQEPGQALLDNELSHWDIYLGYPNAETPVEGLPRDEEGNYTQPVGYHRDDWNVFSVSDETGEPVLRISG